MVKKGGTEPGGIFAGTYKEGDHPPMDDEPAKGAIVVPSHLKEAAEEILKPALPHDETFIDDAPKMRHGFPSKRK